MSAAFVSNEEKDNEFLHQIPATLGALGKYLTKEERRKITIDDFDIEGNPKMTNGLTYIIINNHWEIL